MPTPKPGSEGGEQGSAHLGDGQAKQPQPGRDHGQDGPEGHGSEDPAQIGGQEAPTTPFP